MKSAIILGTRPEIIKMAPVIRILEDRGSDFFILHTGQHYSHNLNRIFFDQLELPPPRYDLEAGSGSHAEETGRMLIGIEKPLLQENPDIVLVEGDTNSVLAGALAASKLGIRIGHIEAGLRSYDRHMPEEINRVITDHIADWLFAPTAKAKQILAGEGIEESKIVVTGNTIVDAVYQNLKLADNKTSIINDLHLKKGQYLLLTLHRQENVDSRDRFASILEGLARVATAYHLPIVFPVHPRARKMMEKYGLKTGHLVLIEPVDFLSFLQLESNARLVFTDSGGVQEETCILRVPCITLRDNTERPETVEAGANMLAGASPDNIVKYAEAMLKKKKDWANPFGDGKAAEKIINVITGV